MSDEMPEATLRFSHGAQAIASEIAAKLEQVCGEPVAFALHVFTPVRAQYVANCRREEVREQLRALLARWDAYDALQAMRDPDIPAHLVGRPRKAL